MKRIIMLNLTMCKFLYMKYSKSNIRAWVTLWVFLFGFNSCSQHPPDSEIELPTDAETLSNDAFDKMNEGSSSTKEDFTGVKTDASGAAHMETIS